MLQWRIEDSRGPEIWDKIVADARKEFDGDVLLGSDALYIDIQTNYCKLALMRPILRMADQGAMK